GPSPCRSPGKDILETVATGLLASRSPNLHLFGGHDHIAKVALGIDEIVAKPLLELLAELRNVAFDYGLIDVFVQQAIDAIVDLRLRQAAAAVAHQVFEDAPLAARQMEDVTSDFRVASVEIDAQVAELHMVVIADCPATDRFYAGHDLTNMHGLAHHVIDTGREQFQRLLE